MAHHRRWELRERATRHTDMGRRVGLAVIAIVVAGCSVGDGSDPTVLGVSITATTTTTTTATSTTVPSPPGMPTHETFEWHRKAAELATGDSFLIDPRNCRRERWAVTLREGVAWVVTSPRATGRCDVWLGGGVDEGADSEIPSTYCRFRPDDHAILIVPGRRGPITLDDPNCGPTGFETALHQTT